MAGIKTPIMAGIGSGIAVSLILAIANGVSTYLFDGQTLSDKVAGRIGGGTA